MTINCSYCGILLTFDDLHIAPSGKKIPLEFDEETDTVIGPHTCMQRLRKTSNLTCNGCGKKIFFHPDFTSKYGKSIPLSVDSGGKHRCPNKPFNRETRRAWWEEQNRKAEEARERKQHEYNERRDRWSKPEHDLYNTRFINACRVLGVPPTATDEEIKQAYRKLILQYHPDRYDGPDAHERAVEINNAYEDCVK